MVKRLRAWGPILMAIFLAGCPIGCPAGNPQTIYEGPEEQIAVQRVGPCSFKVAEPPLKNPYPSSKAGFYGIRINGTFAWRRWVSYDERSAVFSVREPWCKQLEVQSFALRFQHVVRVTNEW